MGMQKFNRVKKALFVLLLVSLTVSLTAASVNACGEKGQATQKKGTYSTAIGNGMIQEKGTCVKSVIKEHTKGKYSRYEPQHPGPIEGYWFREKLVLKDGNSLSSYGATDNTGDDGPALAVCAANNDLYNEAIKERYTFIQKTGDCGFSITKQDWDKYVDHIERTGPYPIRRPG